MDNERLLGFTLDEFLADFPTVSRKAAIAGLEQAKSLQVVHRQGNPRSTSAEFSFARD